MSFTFLAGNSGLPPSVNIITGATTGDGSLYPVQLALAELRKLTLTLLTLEIDLDGLEAAHGGTEYFPYPSGGWDGGNIRDVPRAPTVPVQQDLLTGNNGFLISDTKTEDPDIVTHSYVFAAGRTLGGFGVDPFAMTTDRYLRLRFDLSSAEAGAPILSTYQDANGFDPMTLSDAKLSFFGIDIPMYEVEPESDPPFQGTITVAENTFYA